MTFLSNVDYFKELPYFNVSIEKPEIKRLKKLIYYLNYLFTIN